MFRLLQERLDLLALVQLTDQLALQVVLDEVHQEVHNGLGSAVLDVLPHDHEVGLDEAL